MAASRPAVGPWHRLGAHSTFSRSTFNQASRPITRSWPRSRKLVGLVLTTHRVLEHCGPTASSHSSGSSGGRARSTDHLSSVLAALARPHQLDFRKPGPREATTGEAPRRLTPSLHDTPPNSVSKLRKLKLTTPDRELRQPQIHPRLGLPFRSTTVGDWSSDLFQWVLADRMGGKRVRTDNGSLADADCNISELVARVHRHVWFNGDRKSVV
mgnify:FL=1